jgi:hypothetical protein
MKSSTTGLGGSHFQAEPFYKVLKLKTGDFVLCQFDEEVKDFSYAPTINLKFPLNVVNVRVQVEGSAITNETVALKPFMSLSDSEEYPISTDVIVTMGDMKRDAKELYIQFVERMKQHRIEDDIEQKVLALLRSTVGEGKLTIIEEPTPEGT